MWCVAFLADFQVYLIYTAMPFKALRLGAGPFELGALAAISTGTYALLAGACGRLADRIPRTPFARLSCIGILIGCIGLTTAPTLRWMFLCAPFVGGSMSTFWPSVQASLADRTRLQNLERHLGRFNLSWSAGKSCGFLVGGTLVAAAGVATVFTLASCIAFTIFFLLPGEMHERPPAADPLELHPQAPLFRRLAWAANGVAYGLAATLNHHYPRLVQEFGWSPRTFGVFLGLVYLTQTLTFGALMLFPEAWRYRRSALFLPQLLMVIAVVSLPFAGLGRVLVSALVFGFGIGICYYSSIYYSLHTVANRGRNAGVHEAFIGLGSMAVPLLGGLAARELRALWAPYAVAGGAVMLSLILQETLYRWGRRVPV
ncbi:MAG TPA: MFS transporter [Myxococcales bacterium]|nr:MFS transporter [Myxococcales bacterium]